MTVREIIDACARLLPAEREEVRLELARLASAPHAHPAVTYADFEKAVKKADEILAKHADLLDPPSP